jgi:hypothetical protein
MSPTFILPVNALKVRFLYLLSWNRFSLYQWGKMAEKKREIQRLVDSKHYKAATDRAIILSCLVLAPVQNTTHYTLLKFDFNSTSPNPRQNKYFNNFSNLFLNQRRFERSVHFQTMLC